MATRKWYAIPTLVLSRRHCADHRARGAAEQSEEHQADALAERATQLVRAAVVRCGAVADHSQQDSGPGTDQEADARSREATVRLHPAADLDLSHLIERQPRAIRPSCPLERKRVSSQRDDRGDARALAGMRHPD